MQFAHPAARLPTRTAALPRRAVRPAFRGLQRGAMPYNIGSRRSNSIPRERSRIMERREFLGSSLASTTFLGAEPGG